MRQWLLGKHSKRFHRLWFYGTNYSDYLQLLSRFQKKKMNTSIRNVFCPQEIKHKRHNQGLKTEHKEIEIYRIEKLVP